MKKFRNSFDDLELKCLSSIIDELEGFSNYYNKLLNDDFVSIFSGRNNSDVQKVFRSVRVLAEKSMSVVDSLRSMQRLNLPPVGPGTKKS